MIELNLIRANYASLPDAKLIRLAREDSHELTKEAFALLKEEFGKRGLDINLFLPGIKDTESNIESPIETEEKSLFSPSSADKGMMGLTYEEMMYSKKKEDENKTELLTENELDILIKKTDAAMLKNGVILIIGLIITIWTMSLADNNGGTYVVAWGAILFGGYGMVEALIAKNKYDSALKGKKVIEKKDSSSI